MIVRRGALWWAVAVLLAGSVSLAALSVPLAAAEATSTPANLPSYAVVVDAGSTGSRVMIYTIAPSLGALPDLRLLRVDGVPYAQKSTPGLSAYATRLGDLPDAVVNMLDPVLDHIPEEHVSVTPLLLLATGGMRLLTDSDRQAVLAALCEVISSRYRFRFTCDNARVIPGEEEGLFGWLAVNYVLGTLDATQPPNTAETHIETVPGRTLGVLDMGGASAQISFIVDESEAEGPSVFRLDLTFDARRPGPLLYVYSTSHLGVGAFAARERYLSTLAAVAKDEDGYGASSASSSSSSASSNSSLPADILSPCYLPGHRPSLDAPVIGTGDFDACVTHLREVVLAATCATTVSACPSVDTLSVAVARTAFLGISEYWYSVWDVFETDEYDPASLWPRAREFCRLPHADVLAAKASGSYPHADIARLESECFKLAWVAVVLHDGYGIELENVPAESRAGLRALQISMHVGSEEVSWALGALLVALAGMDDADGRGQHIVAVDDIIPIEYVRDGDEAIRTLLLSFLPVFGFIVAVGFSALLIRTRGNAVYRKDRMNRFFAMPSRSSYSARRFSAV